MAQQVVDPIYYQIAYIVKHLAFYSNRPKYKIAPLILNYYGVTADLTFSELGVVLGVTRQAVQQTVTNALETCGQEENYKKFRAYELHGDTYGDF